MDADDRYRTGHIEALAGVRGWDYLIEDLEAASKRAWDGLIAGLKMGAPIDQRVIDEMRGADKTIRLLKRGPARAAKRLAKPDEEADTSEE